MNEKIIFPVLLGLCLILIFWELRKLNKQMKNFEEKHSDPLHLINNRLESEKLSFLNSLKKQNSELLENYTKIINLNKQQINKINNFIEMEDTDDEHHIHHLSESIKLNNDTIGENDSEYYHSDQDDISDHKMDKLFISPMPIIKNLFGSLPSQLSSIIVDIQQPDILMSPPTINTLSDTISDTSHNNMNHNMIVIESYTESDTKSNKIEIINDTHQELSDNQTNTNNTDIHETEMNKTDIKETNQEVIQENQKLEDKIEIIDELNDSIYSSISFGNNKHNKIQFDNSKDVNEYSSKDLKLLAKEYNLPVTTTKDGKSRYLNKQELYSQIQNIIKN